MRSARAHGCRLCLDGGLCSVRKTWMCCCSQAALRLPAVVVIAGLTRNLHACLRRIRRNDGMAEGLQVSKEIAGQARNDDERVGQTHPCAGK
jgi:hypothetical protein